MMSLVPPPIIHGSAISCLCFRARNFTLKIQGIKICFGERMTCENNVECGEKQNWLWVVSFSLEALASRYRSLLPQQRLQESKEGHTFMNMESLTADKTVL